MAAPQVDAATAASVLAAYQTRVAAQRDAIDGYIRRLWRSLGTYRNAQMTAFTRQAVPAITGAQQNVASLTAAYLAAYRKAHLGGLGKPAGVDPKAVTGKAARGGMTPQQVYERPFHLVWRQIGDGTQPDAAIEAGLNRALQSAATDLQLTKTRTSQLLLSDDKTVSGYRRVLEGAYSCALCVVASTQRYHRGQLMPMHPACDCSVAPLFGDQEHVIDQARLESAHQSIQETFGVSDAGARSPDYRQLLVTHEHGELGPVLARRGAPFLGPHDL